MSETLDSLGDKKEAAEHIVYNFATQKVQIMYLKRIGTTPLPPLHARMLTFPLPKTRFALPMSKTLWGLTPWRLCNRLATISNTILPKIYIVRIITSRFGFRQKQRTATIKICISIATFHLRTFMNLWCVMVFFLSATTDTNISSIE